LGTAAFKDSRGSFGLIARRNSDQSEQTPSASRGIGITTSCQLSVPPRGDSSQRRLTELYKLVVTMSRKSACDRLLFRARI
jgi:hypothetical protein